MKTRLSVLCVALVTVLLLSAFSCSAGAKSSSKIFGDIDGDGLVTASDALKILRISVGLDNPNDEIKMLSDMGHESPTEHVYFTFGIEGISRACSHQIVRHRIASYSQQSQRYVDGENFDFVVAAFGKIYLASSFASFTIC